MKSVLLLSLMIVLTACSSGEATSSIPVETIALVEPNTSTPIPSSTATLEPTATLPSTDTPQPTLTPTTTVLPEALRNEILQAYKVFLFTQVEVNLLNETASRVKSGELSGFESLGAIIAVAALVQAVDEAIAETTPPDLLQVQWDEAMAIHAQTKDILKRWFNKEIDSSVVLEEVITPVNSIEKILSDVDKELSTQYGFDLNEMAKYREEVIKSINEIFTTPTPTP